MEEHHEEKAGEGKDDVADEHCSVVKAWFWEEILVANGTTLAHLERVTERKRSCFEKVSRSAVRTL